MKIVHYLLFLCLASVSVQARELLVIGDSISAGYGIDPNQGWVSQLQDQLQQQTATQDIQVINASISGDTSGGGLQRLPPLLDTHKPGWVIIELGGNDGLRGYPLPQLEQNLEKMITLSQAANAKVVLVGMQIPPNYGARYTQWFNDIYPRLAARYDIPLIPNWLEAIATQPALMQADGIHPTKEAQPLLLSPILETLQRQKLLEQG